MSDPADTIHKVRVVNRNKFAIRDRWDGIPVELLPGRPLSLSPEVAAHILGYPGEVEDMHRHMARRWGWNLPHHIAVDDDGLMLWQRLCMNIEVSTEKFELRRVDVDPNEPIPADGDDIRVHEPPPAVPRRKETKNERSARMKEIWAKRKAAGLRTLEARQAVKSEPTEA